MTVGLGAWLSVIAGAVTGLVDARLPSAGSEGSPLIRALAGAVIAVLAYGMFVAAGLVVGVLTFSTTPDPWPALICVILGSVIFLAARVTLPAVASRFGMPDQRDRAKPRSFDDLLDARPRGGPPTMWLGGVGAALLPIFYGIECIVTQRAELGTLFRSQVSGGAAIALGVGWIGAGLFLHFHFFFGLHPTLQAHSRRGKSIALITACAGLAIGYAWSTFALGSSGL